MNRILPLTVVVLLTVAGYFAFFKRTEPTTQQPAPASTPTTSRASGEDTAVKELLASWVTVQGKFLVKAGESGTYNPPDKVQFISNDTLLVHYDDGLVDHVSILRFKNGQFAELKNVGTKSTMSLGEYQALVTYYGDPKYPVRNYTVSILRDGKLVSYAELTKVQENIFVR